MSKVSRSVFQKISEENKRLKRDLWMIACGDMNESINMQIKWMRHFEREEKLHKIMKAACKKYIKEHADELPDFLTKSIK